MDGGNEGLILQKQEQIRAEIRQQLSKQQVWDLREGQSIQQLRNAEAKTLITKQIEMNKTLSAKMQQMPLAQADGAAYGMPEQTMKPVKKTWKERWEANKRKKAQAKEMKQYVSKGDHLTYAFARAKEEMNEAHDNSFPSEEREKIKNISAPLEAEHRIDNRVLEVFLNGYRKNAQGEPLNEEEEKKKVQDEAFLQDYVSANWSLANGGLMEDALALRRPHLRRITDEILNVKISADMLTDEYMYEHTREVIELAERFTCFINIKGEPTNKPFFDGLSQFEKDWLEAREASMASFSSMVSMLMNMRGIDFNERELTYITGEKLGDYKSNVKKSVGEGSRKFLTVLEKGRKKQQKAVSDQVERLRKERRGDNIEPLQDTAGLKSLRELFLNAPEAYRANKVMLDQLYQQYYRAVDTLRDRNNDSAVYWQIMMEYREATDMHRHLAQEAYQKHMENEEQAQLIRQQMEAMAGQINAYLDRNLTEASRRLKDTRTAELRMKDKLQKISFDRAPERTEGMTGRQRYIHGHLRKDHTEAQPYHLESEERTQRQAVVAELRKKYSNQKVYGGGIMGGKTANLGNASGTVFINGLNASRLLTLLESTSGEGCTAKELEDMLDLLLSGGIYRNLRAKEEANTLEKSEKEQLAAYSPEQIRKLDDDFLKGFQMLKKVYLRQLHRMREKYGRFGSQLHPEDFIARMGLEYFEDFEGIQDYVQIIGMVETVRQTFGEEFSKQYLDYDNESEDREFRDLCQYYLCVYVVLATYLNPMLEKYNSSDLEAFYAGLEKQKLNEKAIEIKEHWKARELEKAVGGDGFSIDEEEAYHRQLKKRVENKASFSLSGRFLSQEEREARDRKARDRKARDRAEKEAAAQLATAHIRTREEATNTDSDLLSKRKREYVKGLVLNKFGGISHNEANAWVPKIKTELMAYYNGDMYAVGYREEYQQLMVVLRELKNAEEAVSKLSDEEKDQQARYINGIRDAREYFSEVTNGTLKLPEDAQVQDFSHQQPTEQGTIRQETKGKAPKCGLSYWSKQKDTPLFSHEPTVNDLKQRMVSNCYMVAGTAGLVNIDPAMLKECIKDNMDGTVTVRLYEKMIPQEELEHQKARQAEISRLKEEYQANKPAEGYTMEQEEAHVARITELEYIPRQRLVPIYVKVSKEIPRVGKGVDTLSFGALWMQMIEKACAFVGRNGVKGYKSLWYGEGGGFLERLLGVSPTNEYNRENGISKEDKAALFEGFCNCQKNRVVYNANTGNTGEVDGLDTGHAYTVMGGKTVGGKKYVLLRNPYSTDQHSDETYGQFYMEFEEFLQKFREVTSTNLNRAQKSSDAV